MFERNDCDYLKVNQRNLIEMEKNKGMNELKLIAHNGSGFDTWNILNNLLSWCRIMNLIKNGKGIISLKIFNGMVNVKSNSKGHPQYLSFTCSMNHMKSSLRILGETYKLQTSLKKQEMDHNEIYEDTWESERSEWEPYWKMNILSLAFIYARYSMNVFSITGFGMKNCLSQPSLRWKQFMSS